MLPVHQFGRPVNLNDRTLNESLCAVFSVRDLQTFTPVELVMMTASVDEDWSLESESCFHHLSDRKTSHSDTLRACLQL